MGCRRDTVQIFIDINWVRQHDGGIGQNPAHIRNVGLAVYPGKQIEVWRFQTMPNRLNRIDINPLHVRQCLLHRPRGHADTQSPRSQFQQCPPLRRRHIIQQVDEIRPDTDFAAGLKLIDNFVQVWKRVQSYGVLRHGPGQSDRLANLPDIIARHIKQERIHPFHHQRLDEIALEKIERQRASDGCQRPASVWVGCRV